MKKIIIALIITCSLFVCLFGCTPKKENATEIFITVEFTQTANGFEADITTGKIGKPIETAKATTLSTSLLAAMHEFKSSGLVSFSSRTDTYGEFLYEICGIAVDETKEFIQIDQREKDQTEFSMAQVGISELEITDGITYKFTIAEF